MSDFERHGCPECKGYLKRIAELETASKNPAEGLRSMWGRIEKAEKCADANGMELVRERERTERAEDTTTKAQSNVKSLQELLHKASNQITRLENDLDDAEDRVADYEDSYQIVIQERCAGDELHCTCVPALRRRVKELENARPATTDLFEDLQKDYFKLKAEIEKWRDAEQGLSSAYLGLRQILGAFDTPHAPTAMQVWEHTRQKAQALVDRVAEMEDLLLEIRSMSCGCDYAEVMEHSGCSGECASALARKALD